VNKYFISASHFLKPPFGYFSDTLSKPELPAFINGLVDPQQTATATDVRKIKRQNATEKNSPNINPIN
jgi:hypothetical protein